MSALRPAFLVDLPAPEPREGQAACRTCSDMTSHNGLIRFELDEEDDEPDDDDFDDEDDEDDEDEPDDEEETETWQVRIGASKPE
jgi:hypothetical protein